MPLRALTVAALLATGAVAAPAFGQYPPPQPQPQPQPQQSAPSQTTLALVTIRDQTDGVNSLRIVTVAAFCRGPAACAGKAKIVKGGQTLASGPFAAAGKTTFKTRLKLKASVFRALRKAKGKRMKPTLTLTLADGQAVSHIITIRI